jgi:hypothetical protein
VRAREAGFPPAFGAPPPPGRHARTIARLKPRLLVLDPFVRLHRIDENVMKKIAPALRVLSAPDSGARCRCATTAPWMPVVVARS